MGYLLLLLDGESIFKCSYYLYWDFSITEHGENILIDVQKPS